jgi:hypothetical protein
VPWIFAAFCVVRNGLCAQVQQQYIRAATSRACDRNAAATQAEFSDAQRLCIIQGGAQGMRNDGRGCRGPRPLGQQLWIIAVADGSSRLHVGTTEVAAGLKVRAAQVVIAGVWKGCWQQRVA